MRPQGGVGAHVSLGTGHMISYDFKNVWFQLTKFLEQSQEGRLVKLLIQEQNMLLCVCKSILNKYDSFFVFLNYE